MAIPSDLKHQSLIQSSKAWRKVSDYDCMLYIHHTHVGSHVQSCTGLSIANVSMSPNEQGFDLSSLNAHQADPTTSW